jgi:RNA polymerase sigma factor (sigma-70 family)
MHLEKPFMTSGSMSSDSLREDFLLWESLRKGNDLAFSSLYKKYVQPLFNYGMHIHPNRDVVKDCLQELFAKIWEKRTSLSTVEKVGFYLFRSFKNLLFNKIEASSKRSSLTPDSIDRLTPELPMENFWIDSEVVEERLGRLKKAVSLLTNRQREVVLLRFFQGLEIKEVAELMNLSVQGVHNLISLTIKSLREKIKWNELTVVIFFLAYSLI